LPVKGLPVMASRSPIRKIRRPSALRASEWPGRCLAWRQARCRRLSDHRAV